VVDLTYFNVSTKVKDAFLDSVKAQKKAAQRDEQPH